MKKYILYLTIIAFMAGTVLTDCAKPKKDNEGIAQGAKEVQEKIKMDM